MIIAIDGPSGAGKSTIAKLVSKNLNFEYIDTGAMYRALAYKAFKNNIPIIDEKIDKMLKTTKIDYLNNSIYLDDEVVDDYIRSENISKIASMISSLGNVRLKMVDLQRSISNNKNVILDGRDIGTNVFPNADYKFFITASVEERAKRRYNELVDKGICVSYDTVLQDIKLRDYNDSSRQIAPLKIADDAIIIDNTNMSIQDIQNKIISIVSEGLNAL
ncbi:cytidylate kinase [Sedimentibacter acidaminivorans]|jgi:CMP/dCMP kinase|uniref:Cytidylate kinase n=1 Tax=Sedimentibacter acidaminivorans TaxID=913099 RepID=A0ABS4GCL4_9FIRM|nr:(d)CMP kinase [Sedimentibacter acidaminivorans]MBP1925397.1 cytidylate kinase [Sedimentibacter acidaminivorans]